jgi:hypothetical protein
MYMTIHEHWKKKIIMYFLPSQNFLLTTKKNWTPIVTIEPQEDFFSLLLIKD